jgi:choline dehydrogenase-like flavoprotein
MKHVHIIGGGLAGSEAAWQVASRGIPVLLHEMRPVRPTLVHKTDQLAELVCSNSFRGDKLDNGPAQGRNAPAPADRHAQRRRRCPPAAPLGRSCRFSSVVTEACRRTR